MRTRKPLEQKLFELTQDEREALEAFIKKSPVRAKRILKLDALISAITLRVAPLYQEGQGMAKHDLTLIDRATGVLAEAEDAMELARIRINRSKRNLNYLYSGTGAPE